MIHHFSGFRCSRKDWLPRAEPALPPTLSPLGHPAMVRLAASRASMAV